MRNLHMQDVEKGFLRSKEELLNTLKDYDEEIEECRIYIYFIEEKGLDLQEVINYIQHLILESKYIWHYSELLLSIKTLESQPKGLSNQYIYGICQCYESIEDEWFCVYLMKLVSLHFSSLFVQMNDMDGEFLLIEAADNIPQWLGPENSANRIWIHQGKYCIITPEICKSYSELTLQEALLLLSTRRNEIVRFTSLGFQKAINDRISIYPNAIRLYQHKVLCILPQLIISFLEHHTNIFSKIVHEFAATDRLLRRKVLSSLSIIGNLFKTYDVTQVSITSLKTTRLLYSKFINEEFTTPKQLQKFEILGNQYIMTLDKGFIHFHDTNNTITSKVLDNSLKFGIRLISGLELLLQRSKVENDGILELFNSFISKFQTGMYQDEIKREDLYIDSDAWLYMSKEEFEIEINNKMDIKSNLKKSEFDSKDDILQQDLSSLSEVVTKLQDFIIEESGIEGVENIKDKASNKESLYNNSREMYIARYTSLLDSSSSNSSIHSSLGSDKELFDKASIKSESSVDIKSSICGIATHVVQKVDVSSKFVNNSNLNDNDSDSDDYLETNDEDSSLDSQSIDFNDYANIMDEEIFASNSTLKESFERHDDSSEINYEANLLKYLMESHLTEDGGVGPTSQLLTQIGANLPTTRINRNKLSV